MAVVFIRAGLSCSHGRSSFDLHTMKAPTYSTLIFLMCLTLLLVIMLPSLRPNVMNNANPHGRKWSPIASLFGIPRCFPPDGGRQDFANTTTRKGDLGIDFVPDVHGNVILPNVKKIYPISPQEEGALSKFVTDAVKKKWIRESTSPIAAPCFYRPKPYGGLRLCIDYHLKPYYQKRPLPITAI
jgi:hypothetical protein